MTQGAIVDNLPKAQDQVILGQESQIDRFFIWSAVFILFIGLLMLAGAVFLYLLAAGEEPKMKKANSVLMGAIFFLVGALVIYLLGRWIG